MRRSVCLCNRLPNVIFFWPSLIASGHESVQRHETINWGNNPDYGKSKDSYIVMPADDLINHKLGLKGPTSQSTMEAELVVAALSLVFCFNMMVQLGSEKGFSSVPLYLDNT